ncbi:MAG: hypothetical protein NXH85_06915 [Pseudomonadaceae bacterium]|nr:hypothetical protein [Pseudomonadaceae bacterium]
MQPYIRLSRLSHPRASIGAIILLVVVFLAFGAVAEQSATIAAADATSEKAQLAVNLRSSQ